MLTGKCLYLRAFYARCVQPTHHSHSIGLLLIILLISIVDDVEESELIDTLGGRDNTEPVSELLLLEELLCPNSNCVSVPLCPRIALRLTGT